jgi:hypothetical protein
LEFLQDRTVNHLEVTSMAQAEQRRFTFDVTAKDIEKSRIGGGEGDSFRCMTVAAIARQIPSASRIEVDLQTIRWTDETGRRVFLTPYEVAGYVVAFDAGEEIHPFRFTLRNSVPALQRKAKTPGAKRVSRAVSKVHTEQERKRNAEKVLADPEATADRKAAAAARVAEAPERIEQARENLVEVRGEAKAAGEPTSKQRVSEASRMAPPKVFKTKRRVYGQRVLRVNQAEGRKHYAG